jgi:hypothetical protein
MTTTEERTIDRSGWGAGPWDDEADRAAWVAHGFACLMRRSDLGAWCGYVGVPPGHPWHGRHYDSLDADVHGGLTFARAVAVVAGVRTRHWLGFDCAHCYDLVPGLGHATRAYRHDLVYRDAAWVRAQVERLAEQAAAAR